MKHSVEMRSLNGMCSQGTVLSSFNELTEIFGKSKMHSAEHKVWCIKRGGRLFAIWLHNYPHNYRKDTIYPFTIGGYGNGYEVDTCREISGLPCFSSGMYSTMKDKFGWNQSNADVYKKLRPLSFAEQVAEIY